MVSSIRTTTIAFVALAALIGVGTAGAAELGKNLAGETCRSAGPLEADQPTAIDCGNSTEHVGEVMFSPAPADESMRHAALQDFVQSQAENLECSEPIWTTGGKAAIRLCALKSTGWARIVIGMEAGGRLYRADGPPSALPALEAAVQNDVTGESLAGENAGLLAALQSKLPDGIVHAPATDFANVKTFVEAARLAGASDRYATAETNYRQALAIEERLYGPTSMVVGQTLMELALQASNQGHFEESQALFRRAGPIIQPSSDENARARYDSYLALDAANRRQYADALNFARQATATRRAQIAEASERNAQNDASGGVPVTQGELAHALRIESEMALRLGDLAAAKAAEEEALWIVSDEPGLPLWWRADTIALAGEINERQGRVVAAEHDLRDARDLDVKLFGDTAPTAFAELRLGSFYARQQVYPASLEAFRAAFAIAAKDRPSRAQVTADDIVAFTTAEVAAGDPATRDAEIFRASQMMGAGVTDQTLARMAARRAAGNEALGELVAQVQAAEKGRELARVELAAEYAKPDEERSGDRERALQADEKTASDHAGELQTKLAKDYPQYSGLLNDSGADLAAVQADLAPNEAMVSYVFGQDRSYALLVHKHGLEAVPLEIGVDALAADIADLRRAFVPTLGRPQEFDLKVSYGLYQALIAPLEGKLDAVDQLVVVPGAELSNLPLATLVTQPGADRDYQHAAWLVRRYALSEAASAGSFVSLREEAAHRAQAPRPFLGLGAPTFNGASGAAGAKALADLTQSCAEQGPIAPELLRSLPPLPGTAQEVKSVGAEIGGGRAVVLLGAEATESDFRSQPLDQFNILYFATHGILPGELHCATEPALALSPPQAAASSVADDGMLRASDIAELKLNADLVVLSACNTAVTEDSLGGGALEGLSDSFFAAGARAVLASHWEVSSGATEKLMIDMFDPENRARGLAQGLRQSELTLIGDGKTAHPYYWAAFTVIGGGEGASAYARSAENIKAKIQ